ARTVNEQANVFVASRFVCQFDGDKAYFFGAGSRSQAVDRGAQRVALLRGQRAGGQTREAAAQERDDRGELAASGGGGGSRGEALHEAATPAGSGRATSPTAPRMSRISSAGPTPSILAV